MKARTKRGAVESRSRAVENVLATLYSDSDSDSDSVWLGEI